MILLSQQAYASDAQGKWETIGLGTSSCSNWTHYRKDPKSPPALWLQSWLEGYVSAYNQFVWTYSTSVTKDLPERSISGFVDQYCEKLPSDSIDIAVSTFVKVMSERASAHTPAPPAR